MKKIIVLIICIFFVNGCYDYRELNNLGIVTGAAIDYKDNMYEVSIEILNDKKEADSSASQKSYTLSGKGKNITEAFANTNLKLDKQAYYPHLKIVVISQNIAEKNLDTITDYFLRDQSIRDEFYLLVAIDSDASKILDSSTKEYPVTTNRLVSMLENNKYSKNIASAEPFEKVVNKMLEKDIDNVLTTVYKNKDDDIKFGGLAVFEKFNMKNILSNQDSITYNLLDNNAKNAYYTTQCKNSNNTNFTLNIYNSKSEIKYKDNKINIALTLDGDANENNCEYDLRNPHVISDLEKKYQKIIKKDIDKLIQTTMKENTDILGFAKAYYQKERKHIDDWTNLDYEIKIDLKINKKGLIFEVYDEN